MLKKVFLQTQFGTPHAWTHQYFENFKRLAADNWHLIVFTPNPWPEASNIHIVPMTVYQFDNLVAEKTGVRVGNFLTDKGVPSKVISDFYCAHGEIFQDYLKDTQYWGFTNWDCVYGRLSRFLPDYILNKYDVWSDDASPAINGIFSLFRNNPYVNQLYKNVPEWEVCFAHHHPTAFDEIRMTVAMRELARAGEIRWGYPEHFPFHSYDRLVMHSPKPNLYFEKDGALIERLEDPQICAPQVKDHYGREIMYFHFSRTKEWPIK